MNGDLFNLFFSLLHSPCRDFSLSALCLHLSAVWLRLIEISLARIDRAASIHLWCEFIGSFLLLSLLVVSPILSLRRRELQFHLDVSPAAAAAAATDGSSIIAAGHQQSLMMQQSILEQNYPTTRIAGVYSRCAIYVQTHCCFPHFT
jgi:hypothetical protein